MPLHHVHTKLKEYWSIKPYLNNPMWEHSSIDVQCAFKFICLLSILFSLPRAITLSLYTHAELPVPLPSIPHTLEDTDRIYNAELLAATGG